MTDNLQGRYDRALFSRELEIAHSNHQLGTTLWFENDRVRVWEVFLEPGSRGPFHAHTTKYFWTVVEGSQGLQRFDDGTYVIQAYQVGDTRYFEHSEDNPLVHDLENVGDTALQFVTVELLD